LLDINSGFDVRTRFIESGWILPTVLIRASDDPELDDAARRAGAALPR